MNIYVGNLNYQLTEDDVRDVFAEFGEVVKVNLITDRDTGRAKGFGFVEMANDADGKKAIQELDGADINGRNMKVNEARPREEKPRRNNW
jgi:RNA recognition motif-containing protein